MRNEVRILSRVIGAEFIPSPVYSTQLKEHRAKRDLEQEQKVSEKVHVSSVRDGHFFSTFTEGKPIRHR